MMVKSPTPDHPAGTKTDLPAHKQVLRRQLTEQREHLDMKQMTHWTQAICQHLLSCEMLTPTVLEQWSERHPVDQLPAMVGSPGIGLFIAMRQEVDFKPIWQQLRTRGFRLCFPRMIRQEGRPDLEFLAIPDQEDPEDHLVQSRFGVREPAAATPQNGLIPCDPTLILLPGLGFDRTGNRLGWGQGYYDHYLARRLAKNPANRPILIGVAYPFQILEQVPAGENDIPIDYLLSPDGLVKTDHS